jgi:mycothiol synthase
VVGAALGLPYPEEGWVHQIAVQREHRRRGLATALLGAVFEEMRSLGLPEVGLSTDSRTGALDLYLDMGMIVRQTFTHYSKLLRPGVDNKATS